MPANIVGVLKVARLPDPPEDLQVIELTDELVTIGWQALGSATSWNVYRDSVLLFNVTTDFFEDSTVSPETEYLYEVEGVNAVGVSLVRADITVTTAAEPLAVPDPPSEFVTLELTGFRGKFAWDTGASVFEWEVYLDDVLVDTVEEPEIELDGLTPSTAYDLSVIARNASGDSAMSSDYEFTTLANQAAEWGDIPTQELVAGVAYSLDLSAFCVDPDGKPLTYSILTNDFSGEISLNGSVLSGTVASAGTGSIEVRANDGFADTDKEIAFDVASAADTTPPTDPTDLVVTVTGSTVKLDWTESTDTESGVDYYRIRRDGAVIGSDGTPPKQFQGVPNGTYVFSVEALDHAGNVSNPVASDPVTVGVAPNTPDTPELGVAALDSTTIQLTWTPGLSGATPDDYDGDFSTTSDTGPWTALTIGLQTSFTHTGRTPGQRVYYRLKAKAGALESGYATGDVATPSSSTRVVYAQADFDNGIGAQVPTDRSQESRRMGNGLNFGAVARSQGSGYGSKKTTNGGTDFDENGLYDVRMMPSVTITGNSLTDNVAPRAGARMLHSVTYRGKEPADGNTMGGTTKHYETINGQPAGTHNDAKCKPRTFLGMTSVNGYGIPWDTRTLVGFSIYIPRSWENGTRLKGQSNNGPMFFESNQQEEGNNGDANSTAFSLHLIVPTAAEGWKMPNGQTVPSGITDTWWCLFWESNPNSSTQGGGSRIALAPLLPHTDPNSDRGKWTDWVIELCYNPFSSAQTVLGWNFRKDTGRFRCWKSSGPVTGTPHYNGGNGNRFISEAQVLYDTGPTGRFGLRPMSSTAMNTPQMKHYCFFHKGSVPEPARTHPVEMCFDEIRMGFCEDRTHALAKDSGLVTKWQSRASTFQDVLPRS